MRPADRSSKPPEPVRKLSAASPGDLVHPIGDEPAYIWGAEGSRVNIAIDRLPLLLASHHDELREIREEVPKAASSGVPCAVMLLSVSIVKVVIIVSLVPRSTRS